MRESKKDNSNLFSSFFSFKNRHGIEDHETPEGRFSLKSKARGMGLLFVERFIAKQEKPFTGVCTHIGGGSSTGGQGSPCRKGENYVLYE